MNTPALFTVETEPGFVELQRRFVAMPVRLAATFEGVTTDAIYARLNRGTARWVSVFGEVWVLRDVGNQPTRQPAKVW